jgi:hypothetical protein
MRFPVSLSIPAGDNRPRYVCASCATIHYQNPKMVLGSIPVWERDGQLQVLLCKRAIEPRYGYWTLPAGFMENNETTAEAAIRETGRSWREYQAWQAVHAAERGARPSGPHVLPGRTARPRFRARRGKPGSQAVHGTGDPWDDLAFPTIRTTLELFFADRVKIREGGSYGFHTQDITRNMRSDIEPAT